MTTMDVVDPNLFQEQVKTIINLARTLLPDDEDYDDNGDIAYNGEFVVCTLKAINGKLREVNAIVKENIETIDVSARQA